MIGKVLGIGRAAREVGAAVGGVAEIFAGNRAGREAAEQERYVRALAQFGEEFAHPATRPFDAFVNGINRLPRPMMALATMGLFGYSMIEPEGFAIRMQGLALVPEPLWWLLGAIVGFYFGARELHHYRCRTGGAPVERSLGAIDIARRPTTVEVSVDRIAPAAADAPMPAGAVLQPVTDITPPPPAAATSLVTERKFRPSDPDYNAALEEWRARA